MLLFLLFLLRFFFIFVITILLFGKYRWDILMNLLLLSLNVHGKRKEENVKRFIEFKNKPNGVAVFTHSTCFDQFIIYKELNESLAAIVRKDTAVFPYDILMKHANCILFEKGSNTVKLIKDYIKNRKSGEPVMGIAPAAAFSNNENQNKLEDFKMGAFLPMTPILPILIKLYPYVNWRDGVSFFQYLYLITTYKEKIYYTVKILNEVNPIEGEKPEEFRDRVKKYMEDEMEKIDVLYENGIIKNE